VLSHPQSLSAIQAVLTELVGGKQPGRRQQQQGWEDEEARDDGDDESSLGDEGEDHRTDDGYVSVRDVKTMSQASDVMTVDFKKFPPVLQELISG
jgi:hypothetical protein